MSEPEEVTDRAAGAGIGTRAELVRGLMAPAEPEAAELLDLLADTRAVGLSTLRVLLVDKPGSAAAELSRAGYRVLVASADPDVLDSVRRFPSLGPGASRGGAGAGDVEIQDTRLAEPDATEHFQAVYLPSAVIAQTEPSRRPGLVSRAASRLAPGGQLIAGTEHVVATGPVTDTDSVSERYTRGDGIQVTEEVWPSTERRRVVLRRGDSESRVDLYLASPRALVEVFKDSGLRLTYQHSEVHPWLPRYRVSVLRAVK